MTVNIITYKNTDISVTLDKKKVIWEMEFNKQRYGNAVELKTSKKDELVGAVAAIVSNAILTLEELTKTK